MSIFGACNDADMLAGRGSTNNNLAVWQFFPRLTAPGLRDSYELVTALMDAGERDLDKVWRRAGVELATPDDRATSDQVTVALSYSVDGGATWTAIDSATLDNTNSRLVTVGDAISARPQSRFIQLKLEVSSVSTWCPVVLGLWAEHETMDLPTRRRRWRFTVMCSDQVITRDSSVDSTGARDLAAGLWGTWDDGAAVPFVDVDAANYTVRIAGIREMISRTADIAMASSDVESRWLRSSGLQSRARITQPRCRGGLRSALCPPAVAPRQRLSARHHTRGVSLRSPWGTCQRGRAQGRTESSPTEVGPRYGGKRRAPPDCSRGASWCDLGCRQRLVVLPHANDRVLSAVAAEMFEVDAATESRISPGVRAFLRAVETELAPRVHGVVDGRAVALDVVVDVVRDAEDDPAPATGTICADPWKPDDISLKSMV